jgi:hypothetical protein
MLALDLPTAVYPHSHSSKDNRKVVAAVVPVVDSGDALIVMCQQTPSFSIGRHAAEIDVAGRGFPKQKSLSSCIGLIYCIYLLYYEEPIIFPLRLG